jgi:hypothetical protein
MEQGRSSLEEFGSRLKTVYSSEILGIISSSVDAKVLASGCECMLILYAPLTRTGRHLTIWVHELGGTGEEGLRHGNGGQRKKCPHTIIPIVKV